MDNCSGIDENTLSNRAFVTGSLSVHRYGIGRFGIGLKRALLRLGSQYAIATNTGTFAAKMRFGAEAFGDGERELSASRGVTTGYVKTIICISNLREGVRHEFAADLWRTTAIKSLSRRYGIYIKKGLKLSVDGESVPIFGPGIRSGGPVVAQTDRFMIDDKVRIYIDAGMHEEYRLTKEKDYEKLRVNALTDQYGWYFVCNDRIIKVASHESDLGWTSNWHQEYYGFVGWVRFVAEDAEYLPWDTKKSSIDPNSSVFRQISAIITLT